MPFRHGRLNFLLCALFAFFYLPVAYWYGWGLSPGTGLDFPSYYHGARFAFVYHLSPYGPHTFDYLPGVAGDHVQPYIYPPPSLLFFWPLAYLPLEEARSTFRVFSHLCYLGSVILLVQLLTRQKGRKPLAMALCLTYLFNFDPAFATLHLGQVNLQVLLLLCLMLLAVRRKAPAWCVALPLSAAILIKTYPLLLLPVFLFRKQFRVVLIVIALLIATTACSYALLPHAVWASWIEAAMPAGGYANGVIHAGFAFNQSINAFTMRLFMENTFSSAPLFHPVLARPVASALACFVAAITLHASWRLRRLRLEESRTDEEFAAYLLMIFLIAPISWDHHLVYILPACALAIGLLVNGTFRGVQAVLIVAALFLLAWKLQIASPALASGWWTLLISAKLYPVLVLWAVFIGRMRRYSASAFLPA